MPLDTTLCAMTFQGNAINGLQQDAFFFIDAPTVRIVVTPTQTT